MSAGPSARRRRLAELSVAAMMHPLGPVLRAAAGQRVERDLLHRLAPILGAGELASDPEAAVTARFGMEAFEGLLPEKPGRDGFLGWALRWRRPFYPGDHVVAAAARLGTELLRPALGGSASAEPPPAASRSKQAVAARGLLTEIQEGLRRSPADALLAAEVFAAAADTHLRELPAPGEQCNLAERCRASGAMAAALGAAIAGDEGELPEADTFAGAGKSIPLALLGVAARSRSGPIESAGRFAGETPSYAAAAAATAAKELGVPGSAVLGEGRRRAWLIVPEQPEVLDRVLLALERLDAEWMDAGEDAGLGFAWQRVEIAGSAAGSGDAVEEVAAGLDRRISLARSRRLRHLARSDYEAVFGVRPFEAAPKAAPKKKTKKKGGHDG